MIVRRLRFIYQRIAGRRALSTVRSRTLTCQKSALLSLEKASPSRWQLLGMPSEIMVHRFGPPQFSFLLHHLVPSSHFIRAVVDACPSSFIFFSFPLVALCAVKSPILDGLMSSNIRARLARVLAMHQFINDLSIRPMRRRPGSRHVYSYKLVVGDQRTGKQSLVELVAKRDTTRAAGKAAKEFEAMRLLWDAGFGLDRSLRIPEPLHHFEDLQVIVQEKARGTKFRSFLGDGSDASVDHARKVGVWLAKLHNLPVSSGQVCSYTAEKASLRMFLSAVSASQPQLEPDLKQCAAVMERCFDSFRNVSATYVHGDFHPDHIFVANNCVTVIDFERFCVGDPARDLGSFIAHVRTTACLMGKSLDTANQQIEVFLQSYFSSIAAAQRITIGDRIAPFVALSSLEALYYVASVLKVTQPTVIAMYVKCLRQAGLSFKAATARAAASGAVSTQRNEFRGELR